MSEQVSIKDLRGSLEVAGVRVLAPGRSVPLSRAGIWEAGSPLTPIAGGVLLTPGPGAPSTEVALQARDAGFAALAVKAHGTDLGPLQRACVETSMALLCVDDEADWLQFERLMGSLIQAKLGSDDIRALPVGNLFALANSIAAATGGAVAIEDGKGILLSYSTIEGQPIDNDRRLSILGRQVPNVPENELQYAQVYRADGVLRMPALPDGGYERLAVPVRAGRQLVGSIWVIDAGTLSPHAEAYLADVAQLAPLQFLRARSAEDLARQRRADIVDGIFAGTLAPRDGVQRLGMPARGPFRVVSLEPRDETGQVSTSLLQAGDLAGVILGTRFPTVAVALREAQIRLLLAGPGTEDILAITSALQHVLDQAESALSLPLLAGVATSSTHARDIVGAGRSTERVLDLLRRQPWRGRLATARELENELALAEVEGLLRSRPELLAQAAREVVAHDAAKGTEYADLLLTWCDARYDVRLTASRLSAHPNTIRYRLGRVADLFGLDLGDPDALLLTWLSLRALQT